MTNSQVGRAIRIARAEQGMSMRELAKKADINLSYMSRLENGMRSPTLQVLQAIGTSLGLSVVQLLSAKIVYKPNTSDGVI